MLIARRRDMTIGSDSTTEAPTMRNYLHDAAAIAAILALAISTYQLLHPSTPPSVPEPAVRYAAR